MISQEVSHHQNTRLPPRESGKVAPIVHIQRQRFFDKNMLPGPKRKPHMFAMQGCRRGQRDSLAMRIIQNVFEGSCRDAEIGRNAECRRRVGIANRVECP